MRKVIQCFNCEMPISRKDGNETVEHIPIQSLFDGFGSEYKINRITVPCCKTCNNETSKVLDEEFRNYIGSISDDPALQPITDKTIKSILEYRKQLNRIHIGNDGRLGLLFQTQHIQDYLRKVFRGLFYHQYKYPLPKAFSVGLDFDKNKTGELSTPYINYLLQNFEYKHSGSPTIFKYILQPFVKNLRQMDKKDLLPAASDKYIALLVFNETFTAMGYASVVKPRSEV